MVLVTLGTGVGGGIVIDEKVLQGAHGAAGEIGHMTVNREETEICTCGKRGCAEQYCSATGIVRVAKKYLKNSA
jgi:glucokinase